MIFSRRKFLTLVSLLTFRYFPNGQILDLFATTKESKMLIKPERLKKGDTVGIVAPSTAVPNPDDISKAKEILDLLGLRFKFAPSFERGSNYKSRSREERADDLIQMFTNSDIRGVFCIRGGYGSGQILDLIDYSLVRNNPKVFVGFSDITALHIAFNSFANLVTYHSPVLLSSFSNYTFTSFKQTLFGEVLSPTIKNPDSKFGVRNAFPIRTIRSGESSGRVIAGNLSIICSLIGTDFEYDFQDSLLLLEDVGEEPYRIDRMLNQLRLAGKFGVVNGIIFGRCDDCLTKENQVWDFSLGEVLDFYFKKLSVPSFYGLMFGHTFEQATIPIGLRALMDARSGTLQYLEPVID